MRSDDPSRTGLSILATLWVLTCALTIWLSLTLTTAAARP